MERYQLPPLSSEITQIDLSSLQHCPERKLQRPIESIEPTAGERRDIRRRIFLNKVPNPCCDGFLALCKTMSVGFTGGSTIDERSDPMSKPYQRNLPLANVGPCHVASATFAAASLISIFDSVSEHWNHSPTCFLGLNVIRQASGSVITPPLARFNSSQVDTARAVNWLSSRPRGYCPVLFI